MPDHGDKIDLTNCDREPIHIIGRVQSFGALIAMSSDWMIAHASENVRDFFGRTANDIVGAPMLDILSEDAARAVRTRLELLHDSGSVARLFGVKARWDSDKHYDIAIYRSGNHTVLEFEKSTGHNIKDYLGHVQPMIGRISESKSIVELCHNAARQLSALTGFDRVMVYKFHDDFSGEVIAEEKKPHMTAYLGLRYPASDIPKQARALYARNMLRIIANVDAATAAIYPGVSPQGEPLDLSMSGIRSVSPIHLEYLRNMKVAASMSVSIMKEGKLWGLFSCHHETSRILSYDVRTAAELFGQMFGFILEKTESETNAAKSAKADRIYHRLMALLTTSNSLLDEFSTLANTLHSTIDCDGVAGYFKGEQRSWGVTPTEPQIEELVKFLHTSNSGDVFYTDNLQSLYDRGASFAECGAGLMAIPVSRSPRDYVILFRKEAERNVRWGGDPNKPVKLGPNGVRLTPRESFDEWRETVKGHCDPWRDSEIFLAQSFRTTLLEVILKLTDAANDERAKAQERQELLIAELNHRVRNILNLIKGLINQSDAESSSPAEFTKIVGGRIHALARAHDQITKHNWSAASLHNLLRTEFEAFLGDKAGRAVITGVDALIDPTAYSTLALVFHELTTNAMKYGALSDSNGAIKIDMSLSKDGDVIVHWRESGGPPVKAPMRRGFGSAVIERSIPFELKGEASVRFDLSGLQARFTVPAQYIEELTETIRPDNAPDDAAKKKTKLSGGALVVEDNLIIAMEAETLLQRLGAERVFIAATTKQAKKILAEHDIKFALLDFHLGDETSEPLAELLQDSGIAFAFATGYGDTVMSTRFKNIPVITKPYDLDGLQRAL